MRFILGCFISACLTGLYFNSYAQQRPMVLQGRVITGGHTAIDAATIVLMHSSDSSAVKTTVTDKAGTFKFSLVNVEPGKYILLVTKIGFGANYAGPFQLFAGNVTVAPDIIVTEVTKQLNEVAVTSNRPDVEVKPGRIILNVQNNVLASGSSAFDILRQSPGVRVDNSNNVSIIGRQSALITIDGKATNLTGDDLVAILRSMPANTIDKIELITSGSAKNDATAGGTINIVSKKGNNLGASAILTATAGYGRYYKAVTGIVFNDRTDKFNIFGNYTFSANKTFHDYNTDRTIAFDNILSDYKVNYNGVQTTNNNTFSIGADFYLTKNQTLGFLVNGTIINDSFAKNNTLTIYNQSVLDSLITATSSVNRNIDRFNYNLNYSNKLDKAGKMLTANFNHNTYSRSSDEYITNSFYNSNNTRYRDPLWLQNISPSTIHIWIGKVDFTNPLSKTAKLDAGIKYSNVTSNNDIMFGPFENGAYTNDPAFTNHFVYTEDVNAAYVNYEAKFNKLDVDAGLRAEQTIAKGNSVTLDKAVSDNYTDLFPHVLLTYNQDDKNAFSLSYSRGIKRPGYEVLNPFLYYSDLYDYRAGNPYLKPEYSNTVELSYTHKQSLVVTLYSSVLNGAYDFNVYAQNDTSKVNITTNINLGKVYSYGVRFASPVIFSNWWNASFFADAEYQRFVAYPQNGNLNKGTQDIVLQTTQNFKVNKTLTLTLSGRYESPSFYGVNQFKSYYFADGGISQQLFDKRATLRLTVSDIFNTLRDRSSTNYENVRLSIVDKKESQIGRLTFTYRLGKTTLKTIQHHVGNEDELKRTNSTN